MAMDPAERALEVLSTLWNTSALLTVWVLFVPGALAYDAALDLNPWRLLTTVAKQLPTQESGEYLQEGYVKTSPQDNFAGQSPPPYSSPLLGMVCYDIQLDGAAIGRSCRPPKSVHVDRNESFASFQECFDLLLNSR